MGVLLSFFSVLKSEINWLISLVSSENTDADQAEAHENPATDHHIGIKQAAVQDNPAADTSTETISHHKDEAPQVLAQSADDSNFTPHHTFHEASDDSTDAPHGSGSFFAFDAFAGFDQASHAAPTPSAPAFTLTSFDVPQAANHATIGDLSMHPLPSLGGDGDEIFSLKGAPSAGGGQTNTGPAWTEWVTANSIGLSDPHATTGLTFQLTFDQSSIYLNNQDSNFIAAVNAVAQHLAAQYDNHVTVSIDVGYNEVEGFKLGSALGESITNYATVTGGYSALQTAYGSLLSGPDPLGNSKHTYIVTDAEGRALGVTSAAPSYDGYIGINSKQDFSFADIVTNHVVGSSTQYDGIGTIAHEFTEVMGRQTWNGAKVSGTPAYSPLDLFHFSSSQATFGQHIYSGSAAGYFALHSADWDGTKPLDTALATDIARMFNTKVGDNSDWAPGTTSDNPPDAYDASGGQGSVSPISHVDFLVMEAVGWHPSQDYTGVWG